MKPLVQIKQPVPQLRSSALLISLVLACFALSQRAPAVVPAPDGGYPGGNTAEGHLALGSLTTGIYNNAVGIYSLLSLTTGNFNTATGAGALLSNTADQNTATGAGTLLSNTTGGFNTANGTFALFSNTTGGNNTAMGVRALFTNTEGSLNTANGQGALFNNTTGPDNTAIGFQALLNNTTGGVNIALGNNAGASLTTGNNNIDIGNNGVAGESDTIRIGSEFQTRTFIAAIRGVTTGVADAINVVIDSNGQLGTLSSSRRFKKEIKPMDKASESILALKPVRFHYKTDTTNTPQFGLVAEEVAEVNPDLVVRDKNDEIYTVRYDAVNAMLLNEFLKEHRRVEEQEANITGLRSTTAKQEATITKLESIVAKQEATIVGQQATIEAVSARLNEQAAQIQRVSAQVEMGNPAPQMVGNQR
jgi:uncharacterized coiled-coil protein SlyX